MGGGRGGMGGMGRALDEWGWYGALTCGHGASFVGMLGCGRHVAMAAQCHCYDAVCMQAPKKTH